jgi:4-amino-4-deoxy-L-arabinose transferase-like glycosyltransferase
MNNGYKTRVCIFERLLQARNLLAAMVSLQVLWLLVRKWPLDNEPHWRKIPLFLVYTVVVGVAIGRMPAGFMSRIRQVKERLVQNEKLLILTLGVVVLIAGVAYADDLRFRGDEESSFEASKMVAMEGVASFFTNYAQIPWLGYQHPPLVPLVYGFTMRVLGVNLFVMRFIPLFLGLAVVLMTYFLGRELYDRYTGFLAAFLLISFPLFLRVGTLANNDMPVTFCFSLALLLTLYLLRTPTYWLSVAVGIVIGAGFLSKYTMVLIYAVLIGSFAVNVRFRRLKLHLGIVSLVSVGVLAMWLVYAYHIDVLAAHWSRIASYAGVGTKAVGGLMFMSRWRTQFRLTALWKYLPYSLGVYNIPMLFLGGLYLMRCRRQSDLFVLLWIAAVFLPLVLILPAKRYFMPAFPAVAIAMAHGLRRFAKAREQAVMLALLYCGEALYLSFSYYAHLP